MRWKLLTVAAILLVITAVVLQLALPQSTLPCEWSVRVRSATLNADVYSLVFTPDGKRVVGKLVHGRIRIWDAADGEVLSGFEDLTNAGQFAVDTRGSGLAIAIGKDVVFRSFADGRETRRLSFDDDVSDLVMSADGARLLVELCKFGEVPSTKIDSSLDIFSRLVLMDLDTGQTVWSAGDDWNAELRCLALSPNGRQVVVVGMNSTEVHDLGAAEATSRRLSGPLPDHACFLDENRLVVGNGPDPIVWYLRHMREESFSTEDWLAKLECLATSASGNRVAAGGFQHVHWAHSFHGVAVVFDATSREVVGTIETDDRLGLFGSNSITSLAISPDGRRLVTAASNGRLSCWTLP